MLPQHNPRPPSWYFKMWGMIVLLLLFGPLAFPFLWASKSFTQTYKIILTIVFTILTIWLVFASMDVVRHIVQQFRDVGLIQ